MVRTVLRLKVFKKCGVKILPLIDSNLQGPIFEGCRAMQTIQKWTRKHQLYWIDWTEVTSRGARRDRTLYATPPPPLEIGWRVPDHGRQRPKAPYGKFA